VAEFKGPNFYGERVREREGKMEERKKGRKEGTGKGRV